MTRPFEDRRPPTGCAALLVAAVVVVGLAAYAFVFGMRLGW